ncbi:MAG: acetyl-CoA carboxylase carboxyltransferase subunit alpha [Candidatus Krumholzibacteria bacterium]|nr:acetyl-CoA carboxylase carboxyltransferase subunit alpha [Candidatus Krumholzibacteria bacterium]
MNQGTRGLQFEKPILELDGRIEELKRSNLPGSSAEVLKLKERLEKLEKRIYRNLSPWEMVQLARHSMRPTTTSYIGIISEDFQELHGDRRFGDDPAVKGGLARIGERKIVIIGHEKGSTTKGKLKHNFGMAKPEGFRKALRIMKTAEKFKLPILSLIDTPGAYPGVGAEERGQPQAIAENLKEIFQIRTPVVVVIIGEGGSGGALAIAVGDRVLMMENAIYSVISPEGCAAILWKSREKAPEAAECLRLTAADCFELGVVDRIIEEVHGASHRDPEGNGSRLRDVVLEEFEALDDVPIDILLRRREEKYYSMGIFEGGESG